MASATEIKDTRRLDDGLSDIKSRLLDLIETIDLLQGSNAEGAEQMSVKASKMDDFLVSAKGSKDDKFF